MRKPFIMTHSAIFILTLCTLISYLRSMEHMCCDGGLYYFDIVWYLSWVMFFSFIMIIFDVVTLIKSSKEKNKNGDSKKKS